MKRKRNAESQSISSVWSENGSQEIDFKQKNRRIRRTALLLAALCLLPFGAISHGAQIVAKNISDLSSYTTSTVTTSDASSKTSEDGDILSKIESLYQQLTDLDAAKEELDAKIEAAKSDIDTTLAAKTLLDEQVEATQSQIDTLDEIISQYDELIAEKQAEIDAYQADLDEKYAVFAERLRQSYEEGYPSVLEIFFNSDNFIDMLTSIERMNDILQYDQDIMNDLEEQTQVLRDEQAVLEEYRQDRKSAEEELLAKKEILDAQIADSLTYISDLESNITLYTGYLLQLDKEEAQLNASIEAAIEEYNSNHTGSETIDFQLTEVYKKTYVQDDIIAAMEEGTLQMGSDYFADGQEYVFPLSLSEYANGMLTSRFGWRTYTNSAGETVTSNHKGLDFSLPYGSSIYAAKTGVVISAGYNGNYGNCIVLLHNDGTETRYAHCSKIDVVVGEYILQGEEIGKVGSTGNATGNCLHFEILYSKDGDWTAVDPLPFISLPHL